VRASLLLKESTVKENFQVDKDYFRVYVGRTMPVPIDKNADKPSLERPQLLEKTLELLRNRPQALTLHVIAKETGLTIAWLEFVSAKSVDECGDPSVSRVVTLYEYLSKKKLVV
jgi:hypothetical protein